jgi:radical SAM superfamily enzyme
MLDTVRYLSALTPVPDGIKLQLLHILKGTELARKYLESPFPVMTLDEYCCLVVRCLKLLPPETVVHRITGDGPKKLLIAPLWSADKKKVLNTMQRYIRNA